MNNEKIIKFLAAAASGDGETMKSLLDDGMEINVQDNKGRTAIMAAAFKGQGDIVKFLVKCGADINIVSSDGYTAIELARKANQNEVVELLKLESAVSSIFDECENTTTDDIFADVTRENNHIQESPTKQSSVTPVDYSSSYLDQSPLSRPAGPEQSTRLLRQFQNLINNKKVFVAATLILIVGICLCLFIFSGPKAKDESDESLIVTDSEEANETPSNGLALLPPSAPAAPSNEQKPVIKESPDLLLTAAGFGDIREVKRLVEKGFDVNRKDKDGFTPLHNAAWHTSEWGDQPEIVEYLIEHGADVNAKNKFGNTPLIWGAMATNSAKCLEILIKNKADINVKGYKGETALHVAAEVNNVKNAKVLIDGGADTEIKNDAGLTPAELAKEKGSADVLELLRSASNNGSSNGNSSGSTGNETFTSFHNAALKNDVSAINEGAAKGADLNATDARGYTPLHAAIAAGNIEAVEALINAGADVNKKAELGSPLRWAQKRKQDKIVKKLKSRGAKLAQSETE